MPKVCINKQQYKEESIGGWICGQLFTKKMKKKDLAESLGVTCHGLSWKLHHNSFDYSDLLTVFEFLGSTDEEIVFVMKP